MLNRRWWTLSIQPYISVSELFQRLTLRLRLVVEEHKPNLTLATLSHKVSTLAWILLPFWLFSIKILLLGEVEDHSNNVNNHNKIWVPRSNSERDQIGSMRIPLQIEININSKRKPKEKNMCLEGLALYRLMKMVLTLNLMPAHSH